MKPIVPSPLPPWSNPPVSPLVQTCVGDDQIQLGVDTTYLSQPLARDAVNSVPPGPSYVVSLPNGNYQRQCHWIMIQGASIPTTQPFKITGTFAGFVTLLFNGTATIALLIWDGTAWQLAGGNAQASAQS